MNRNSRATKTAELSDPNSQNKDGILMILFVLFSLFAFMVLFWDNARCILYNTCHMKIAVNCCVGRS